MPSTQEVQVPSTSKSLRIALISGDGLPVSGLLTVFRNVIQLAQDEGYDVTEIPTDLGYSWRPDKSEYFPYGPRSSGGYPSWAQVSRFSPEGVPELGRDLEKIRASVARYPSLTDEQKDQTRGAIKRLARPYTNYFLEWFETHSIDYVFAENMTLPDAPPVTLALHRAAKVRWGSGTTRRGGLIFWDHDLLSSYNVRNPDRSRTYPSTPNEFTLLPRKETARAWLVVSKALGKEARSYGSDITPQVVPNLLPTIPDSNTLGNRHIKFLEQQRLTTGRPLILVPVRLFPVKGAELAIELFRELHETCVVESSPTPYLLIFGSTREDPAYSDYIRGQATKSGISHSIRFLDGVPLSSFRDGAGTWHLNEVDLLLLARQSCGGVFFTPSVPDVESVGLGPALAAVAEIPCITTTYKAWNTEYGPSDFPSIITITGSFRDAIDRFYRIMSRLPNRDAKIVQQLKSTRAKVEKTFPTEAWRNLLGQIVADQSCA